MYVAAQYKVLIDIRIVSNSYISNIFMIYL